MLQGKTLAGELVEAAPDLQAFCPTCNAPLLAKCGEINLWHWAHQAGDCDPWHEPETEWHLAWKRLVRPEYREVTLGCHRADIRTPEGRVIELQHSPLSVSDINEREKFYNSNNYLVWIFDAVEFKNNLWFSGTSTEFVHFTWRYLRKTLRYIPSPLFFDLQDGRVFEVIKLPSGRSYGNNYGKGTFWHLNDFLNEILGEALITPAPPPGRLLSISRATEALSSAARLGHLFASSEPGEEHICLRCHLPLDHAQTGEPNSDVVAKQCIPRVALDLDEEVPF